MDRHVHLAALRAAAKLTMGISFVAGCSSTDAPAIGSDDTNLTDHAPTPASDASAPCDGSTDAGAPSCESLLASAFPSPAWDDFRTYRTEAAPLPTATPEVRACCEKITSESEQRWECCNLLGGGDSLGSGLLACTPWGPPVPPAMRLLEVA